MDRDGLADFLRRRREALLPDEVGVPTTTHRRTPGLRREEVAALAHISTDFYERLEQRRGSRPSEQTIATLARALRFTPAEREHLFELAGYNAPPRAYRSDHPSPGLMRVLNGLELPAQIQSDIGVTLVQNPLARALVGDQTRHAGPARSLIYRWFTDTAERAFHPEQDHALISRTHAAALRSVHGRPAADAEAEELVTMLLAGSEEFAELWQLHEIASPSSTHKHFLHPVVGNLTLDCQVLTAENRTERLVIFSPAPGSEDADRLELLSLVGTQAFLSADLRKSLRG